jgi:phospholipid/cholesterol/gamma-HCH transport system permease protein
MTQNGPSIRFVTVKRAQDKTCLVLGGKWTIDNASLLTKAIESAEQELGHQPFEVAAEGIEKLDTSGALLLKRLLPEKLLASHLAAGQRELLDFLPAYVEYKVPTKENPSALVSLFDAIGKKAFVARDFMWEVFVFIGRIFMCLLRNVLRPHHLRVPSIVRHIRETGIMAILIIGLLAISISMVITYQGALQLKEFGANIYTIDLTVAALLREMSVLVTSIMVAGRSGSAFAAEIGVMTLREEVNALRTMGLDPIEVLVLPRVIALLITLPILTLLADVVGIAGTGIMSVSLLNVSIHQYVNRVQEVASITTFFVGMIKAPVFAFVIAVIGCYQGLNVSGSAESIGRRTTLAVVQAIFIVIMADALFSVFFSKVDI